MKLSYYILICLFLSSIVTPVWARSGGWMETDSWFGRSSKTTRVFRVAGERWRLYYLNHGSGSLRIRVLNQAHEQVYEVYTQSSRSAIRTVPARSGEYYLLIESDNSSWEVEVRQHISRLQEWRLREEERDFMSSLEKVASFSGAAGEAEYDISVPDEGWRMVYSNSRPGRLTLGVRGKGSERYVFYRLMERPARDYTWLHQAGEYKLEVDAENTRWRVDFYAPVSELESGD